MILALIDDAMKEIEARGYLALSITISEACWVRLRREVVISWADEAQVEALGSPTTLYGLPCTVEDCIIPIRFEYQGPQLP